MNFFVPGIPRPQGSKRAYVIKGKPILTESGGQAHKDWRAVVALAGSEKMAGDPPFDAPLHVDLIFYLPRPKTVRRGHPSTRPDVDKLARAVLDALTHICWKDDAQIVTLYLEKNYANDRRPIGLWVYVRSTLVAA